MGRPKKVSRFTIREFKNASGNLSFRVSGHKSNGSRVRQNFATRPEAENAKADFESELHGQPTTAKVRRTRLSDDQLSEAEAAIRTVGERGLAEIVSKYLSIEGRLKKRGVGIDEAVSFAESHFRKELISVTILNAQTEFIRSRAGKEARTVTFYENTLRHLLKPDPNRHLSTVGVADIERLLDRFKNTNSKRAYRSAFSVFFNWAVRHHYCLENPCQRLDKLPRNLSQIELLPLDAVERMLFAAMTYQDGVAAAPIAIGLFGGLRPSEIADLKPTDVGMSQIRVTGGKMRRKLKRTVPIPPVLAEWLKKYPFTSLPKGWEYKLKQIKKATKALKWVPDIIRHTSISFQTERDKNEALTAYNNGTSIQMMNLHYRSSIADDKIVNAFWSMSPNKLFKKKPKVDLPNKLCVDWPDKKALQKVVWELPLIHAAKSIGVSNVALKKRCVSLGIALPTMGHWLRCSGYLCNAR